MYSHHVAIRLLAQRMALSMKLVHCCRQEGITDRHVVRNWIQALTGQDPGPLHAPVVCLVVYL